VKLGISREELRVLLGEPDDTGAVSRNRSTPAIWKYGPLEFHFGPRPSDSLSLIYMETESGNVQLSISKID
jgi:hypothetical protein